MKKIIQLPVVALCAFTLWSTSSCKKKDDDPVCRIKTISNTGSSSSSIIILSYTADGKLSSVQSSGSSTYTKTFTYPASNAINIVEKDGSNTVTYTYDVTLNGSGKITSIIEKNGSGVLSYTTTISYDANGNASSITNTPASGTPSTTTATFANGNLTNLVSGSDITTIDYYTDKAFMDGDYLKISQMIQYGALYFTNKNLIKSFNNSGGSSTTNMIYEFDNSGKISKMTLTNGSSIDAYTYTYDCN